MWAFDQTVFDEVDSINLFSIIWYGARETDGRLNDFLRVNIREGKHALV
jgi:hypothetical protein